MPKTEPPKPLTAAAVAKKQGVSRRTVARWIVRGVFPHAYKLDPERENSDWLIPVADYEAYLKSLPAAPPGAAK